MLMTALPFSSSRDGISEAQGTLVLIAVVVILVILVKFTVGDSIVAAALDFGNFRAWGGHNVISYTKSAPGIEITYPVDGGSVYADQQIAISGIVTAAAGRNVSLVYYRLNGGPWKKADVAGKQWSGAKRKYLVGSYHVEAIAYDNVGDESPMASSTFESLFRPYPDSKYVSDDIPKEMTAGDWYDVHIKYSNTGYMSWNDTYGYSLSPYEPTFTGETPIGMGVANVLPSTDYTFGTRLTAPKTIGDQTISYMMRLHRLRLVRRGILKERHDRSLKPRRKSRLHEHARRHAARPGHGRKHHHAEHGHSRMVCHGNKHRLPLDGRRDRRRRLQVQRLQRQDTHVPCISHKKRRPVHVQFQDKSACSRKLLHTIPHDVGRELRVRTDRGMHDQCEKQPDTDTQAASTDTRSISGVLSIWEYEFKNTKWSGRYKF